MTAFLHCDTLRNSGIVILQTRIISIVQSAPALVDLALLLDGHLGQQASSTLSVPDAFLCDGSYSAKSIRVGHSLFPNSINAALCLNFVTMHPLRVYLNSMSGPG